MVVLYLPLIALLETRHLFLCPSLSIQTHPWPRTAGFPFGGNQMDALECPPSTVACGGSCTSTAQWCDGWCGAEVADALARLGQCHFSKRVCESTRWGWSEGGAMSLFGLCAQQH